MSNNIFKQLTSLHWRMIFCYLLLFFSGDILVKTQGEFSDRPLLLAIHNSFGVRVFAGIAAAGLASLPISQGMGPKISPSSA